MDLLALPRADDTDVRPHKEKGPSTSGITSDGAAHSLRPFDRVDP